MALPTEPYVRCEDKCKPKKYDPSQADRCRCNAHYVFNGKKLCNRHAEMRSLEHMRENKLIKVLP